MAVSTRRIKARIKSIGNTRKITKAMELVASAKMRKAVQMTVDSRPYSGSVKTIVDDIRPLINQRSHPLLYGRKESTKTILIIAASDRGMCGGFNAQLVKKSAEFIKLRKEPVSVVIVGKKIESSVRRITDKILASFPSISNSPSFDRSKSVGQLAYDEFLEKRTDRVFLCYSDFKSAISQVPTIVQLLPIVPEEELMTTGAFEPDEKESTLADMSESERLSYDRSHSQNYPQDCTVTFEPTPRYVLDHLLPRLIDTRLYQAMLESAASEFSARMMAMRSATDSATEMLDNLTFTFNQARQAGITREISEISAGKAALEN
ncbi:MAG: ATP synthase F1 subunit gamma [Patescibacteria group bacterium]|jgi:F-type H+-transporting ATPase subunit gamma|nr:ATP synthase F1 subunit gamma [Patescibacteria group bacterium]